MDADLTMTRAVESKRVEAKVPGYSFSLDDDFWHLEKNVRVNVSRVSDLLAKPTQDGFRRTLAFYARELSPYTTSSCAEYFLQMIRTTGADEVSTSALINYRAGLTPQTEWHLANVRGFLRRWYLLGHAGISEDVIRLLDGWRLKGNRKGDAVKRMDPDQGPLTEGELQSLNEGVVRAYEQDLISIDEMAVSLVVSHTGRRPLQISHLRVVDVLCGRNTKNEPSHLLNVPRGKQRDGFRESFKAIAITEELWTILSAQARHSIEQVESCLGFDLAQSDREQVPLFPDLEVAKSVSSIHEFRQLVTSDKLHVFSDRITETLKLVVELADVYSERTGELLNINSRRLRYTIGTRAAREGFGELVIAELLDHTDTQNTGVYVKNIPEHVKRIDEAVGFQLAQYAQAFAGVLVDAETDAKRGDDPSSRIRTEEGRGIGTCGEFGFCNANVPIPCYSCMHFQPWLDAPHEKVYRDLLNERKRLVSVTGDLQVAAILDRSILAVADVILRCGERRKELGREEAVKDE